MQNRTTYWTVIFLVTTLLFVFTPTVDATPNATEFVRVTAFLDLNGNGAQESFELSVGSYIVEYTINCDGTEVTRLGQINDFNAIISSDCPNPVYTNTVRARLAHQSRYGMATITIFDHDGHDTSVNLPILPDAYELYMPAISKQ